MKRRTLLCAAALAVAFAASPAQAERIKIHLWHAMDSGLGEGVKEIVKRFNESQDKYEVVETWKGRYRVVLNNTIAAYRAGEHPHIFQNNETGFLTLKLSDVIVPVHELLEKEGVTVDLSAYLPPVVDTYTDENGRLLGMPFNSSTPIMYYNRALLRQAGIQAGATTWQEMESQIETLKEKGVVGANGKPVCGYAFSGSLWADFENWSAIHNLPYASLANGRDGLKTELVYNTTQVKGHIERLARWLKEGHAAFGAESPVDWSSGAFTKFANGNCAYWAGSTASHARVEANVKFDWNATYLPYDAAVTDKPINSTIGGAALYVLKGFSDEEYAGVAAFFNSLTSVETQKYWHKKTGYVPITKQAYEQVKAEGYYESHPTMELAVKQLLRLEQPTENSRVPRIGNFENVRIALEAELREVWAGKQDAQTALDNGVRRGNEILRRFEKQNQGKI